MSNRNSKAKHFAHILEQCAGFELFKEALVIPVIFCGTKIRKEQYRNCQEYVQRFLKGKKKVCIVSNDVYKIFFEDGAMPELLYGRSSTDTRHPGVRFFFFSDYRNLEPEGTDFSEGEQYWMGRIHVEATNFALFLAKGVA